MQHRQHLLDTLRGLLAVSGALPHPDLEARGMEPSLAISFEFNNLQLRLVHSEEPPRLRNQALIECRMGPMVPGNEEAQYEQMLDANYRLCATNSAFCIDAESGEVLYTCAFAIDRMKTDDLIRLLAEIETIYAQRILNVLALLASSADAAPAASEFLQA